MELASCKFRKKEIQNDPSRKKFCRHGILFSHLVQILFSFSVYPRLLFLSRNCSHYYPGAAEILSENVFIRELFSLSPNHLFSLNCLLSVLLSASLTDRHSSIKHHIPSLPTLTWKEKRDRGTIRQRKGRSHPNKYFDASNNRSK